MKKNINIKANINLTTGDITINGTPFPLPLDDFVSKVKEENHPYNRDGKVRYVYSPTQSNELKKENLKLKNQVSTTQTAIKATRETNRSLKDAVDSTTSKALELEEKIKSKEKKISSLEKQNKELRDALMRTKDLLEKAYIKFSAFEKEMNRIIG